MYIPQTFSFFGYHPSLIPSPGYKAVGAPAISSGFALLSAGCLVAIGGLAQWPEHQTSDIDPPSAAK